MLTLTYHRMPFPDNLRRIRLEQFLSQAELARRSGVHPLTVTRLESGKTAPSTRTVRALAEALGVMPSDLATPEEVAEADRLQTRSTGD
jgi:transcriptional regulator with XRE-family HTH domain